ncbi:hypothetical protein [Buttiauxella sp. B2]|uniref:hypothetical protein n=1 Tax=Buttiauxella sp. B2 TaxID=2587812 RepID=UPI0016796C93|nr:hypothetical protein [Buttiauxella sp. B2]
MRSLVLKDEIEMLLQDVRLMKSFELRDDEVYHALQVLELRRQTEKIEFLKKNLCNNK